MRALPALALGILAACTRDPLDGCRTVGPPAGDVEIRCPGMFASYGTTAPAPVEQPSPGAQRVADAVGSSMGSGPAGGRATFQLAGRGYEATWHDRASPKGRFVEHRLSSTESGHTRYLSCGTIADGQTPPARCKALLEHLLGKNGPAGIPPEPNEGTPDAPMPLGRPLTLPAGCQVAALVGGDGSVACDDQSTAIWMKVDPALAGDPVTAGVEVLRTAVPPPMTWLSSEPRCSLGGVAAKCRELVLQGGAAPLRARLASANVNGSLRFAQCMIFGDSPRGLQLCDQLITP